MTCIHEVARNTTRVAPCLLDVNKQFYYSNIPTYKNNKNVMLSPNWPKRLINPELYVFYA